MNMADGFTVVSRKSRKKKARIYAKVKHNNTANSKSDLVEDEDDGYYENSLRRINTCR